MQNELSLISWTLALMAVIGMGAIKLLTAKFTPSQFRDFMKWFYRADTVLYFTVVVWILVSFPGAGK